MLAEWIAESFADDHRRGITHGSGLASTGSIWCAECWAKFLRAQLIPDETETP